MFSNCSSNFSNSNASPSETTNVRDFILLSIWRHADALLFFGQTFFAISNKIGFSAPSIETSGYHPSSGICNLFFSTCNVEMISSSKLKNGEFL